MNKKRHTKGENYDEKKKKRSKQNGTKKNFFYKETEHNKFCFVQFSHSARVSSSVQIVYLIQKV